MPGDLRKRDRQSVRDGGKSITIERQKYRWRKGRVVRRKGKNKG